MSTTEAGTQPIGSATSIPAEQVFDLGVVGKDVHITTGVSRPQPSVARIWSSITSLDPLYSSTVERVPPCTEVFCRLLEESGWRRYAIRQDVPHVREATRSCSPKMTPRGRMLASRVFITYDNHPWRE